MMLSKKINTNKYKIIIILVSILVVAVIVGVLIPVFKAVYGLIFGVRNTAIIEEKYEKLCLENAVLIDESGKYKLSFSSDFGFAFLSLNDDKKNDNINEKIVFYSTVAYGSFWEYDPKNKDRDLNIHYGSGEYKITNNGTLTIKISEVYIKNHIFDFQVGDEIIFYKINE